MNNVSLIGNISTDVELRYTPNGAAVVKFNLAVTNPYNRDKTNFIPIEVWKKQAENVANFCSKGSKVGIVGQIEIDQYEKDGQKKTFTKVIANNVEFLTPKNSDSSQNNNPGAGQQQNYTRVEDDPFANSSGPIEISDSDLPF